MQSSSPSSHVGGAGCAHCGGSVGYTQSGQGVDRGGGRGVGVGVAVAGGTLYCALAAPPEPPAYAPTAPATTAADNKIRERGVLPLSSLLMSTSWMAAR